MFFSRFFACRVRKKAPASCGAGAMEIRCGKITPRAASLNGFRGSGGQRRGDHDPTPLPMWAVRVSERVGRRPSIDRSLTLRAQKERRSDRVANPQRPGCRNSQVSGDRIRGEQGTRTHTKRSVVELGESLRHEAGGHEGDRAEVFAG
jgi:hypothetical protein